MNSRELTFSKNLQVLIIQDNFDEHFQQLLFHNLKKKHNEKDWKALSLVSKAKITQTTNIQTIETPFQNHFFFGSLISFIANYISQKIKANLREF